MVDLPTESLVECLGDQGNAIEPGVHPAGCRMVQVTGEEHLLAMVPLEHIGNGCDVLLGLTAGGLHEHRTHVPEVAGGRIAVEGQIAVIDRGVHRRSPVSCLTPGCTTLK